MTLGNSETGKELGFLSSWRDHQFLRGTKARWTSPPGRSSLGLEPQAHGLPQAGGKERRKVVPHGRHARYRDRSQTYFSEEQVYREGTHGRDAAVGVWL